MAIKLENISENPDTRQFFRFLAVGASGTVVDFGLLTVLKLAGLPTVLANTVSFGAGTINNFVLNRVWTFEDAKDSDWKGQFVQFLLVSLVGLLMNNAIVWGLEGVFSRLLDLGDWSYVPAKLIATGIVVFWNYFANRTWTFHAKEKSL